MNDRDHSPNDAAQWRTHIRCRAGLKRSALLILPLLLLGLNSSSDAQTEVAERPSEGTQGLSTPVAAAPSSEASKKPKKKKGPNVTGYLQYHFNQPIDTNNNGAAPSRFRVQRARLTLEGEVNDRVSYEMDIDPRSPELSGLMRDAFVNVELHQHHTLR
jgi:hypothetical protein